MNSGHLHSLHGDTLTLTSSRISSLGRSKSFADSPIELPEREDAAGWKIKFGFAVTQLMVKVMPKGNFNNMFTARIKLDP